MSTSVTSQPSSPPIMPSTSSSSSSSSNAGLGSPGMNFFFGFLIAFIALLLFFVGCGFGARRSLLRNRRLQQRLQLEDAEAAAAAEADLEGLVVTRKSENGKLPVFWDRWIAGGEEKKKKEWESITPLAAMVVPEGADDDDKPPPSSLLLYSPATPNWLRPRTPEPRSWRRSIQSMIVMPFTLMFVDARPTPSRSVETLSSLPPPGGSSNGDGAAISLHSLSRPGSRVVQPLPTTTTTTTTSPDTVPPPPTTTDDGEARKSSVSDPPVKPPPPINVQVTVMIAMPSRTKKQEEEEQRIPHIQFGITRVPVLCDDDDESML